MPLVLFFVLQIVFLIFWFNRKKTKFGKWLFRYWTLTLIIIFIGVDSLMLGIGVEGIPGVGVVAVAFHILIFGQLLFLIGITLLVAKAVRIALEKLGIRSPDVMK